MLEFVRVNVLWVGSRSGCWAGLSPPFLSLLYLLLKKTGRGGRRHRRRGRPWASSPLRRAWEGARPPSTRGHGDAQPGRATARGSGRGAAPGGGPAGQRRGRRGSRSAARPARGAGGAAQAAAWPARGAGGAAPDSGRPARGAGGAAQPRRSARPRLAAWSGARAS
jgi:hypothetical protein